jgi:glycosyltransferase involved in cell wall biosynthesis
MKILFSDNSLWGLLNFRGVIIRRLLGEGHEVVLVAPKDELSDGEIPSGARYIEIALSRTGMNPLSDARYMRTLRRIYKQERPDHIFHYTIKPNIYGTLAARSLDIPSTAMVAGVGHVFTENSFKNRVARRLYRLAMRYPEQVLVLNRDNRDTLTEQHVVAPEKLLLLTGGEGLDLDGFPFLPMPANRKPVFLMICRLLYEKGYAEYVAAAEALGDRAEFRLMGPLDSHPSAVQRETLENDIKRGVINYIAYSPDVASQVARADCVVLPSFYGEGLSRVLMEGAATGRPLITTHIAGCREAVDDAVSGFLAAPKDAGSLIEACSTFISLTPDERGQMGRESRLKAQRQFSVDSVYNVYRNILSGVA